MDAPEQRSFVRGATCFDPALPEFRIKETIDRVGLRTIRQHGSHDRFQRPPNLAPGRIGLGLGVSSPNRSTETDHPEQRLVWKSSEHELLLPSMTPLVHEDHLMTQPLEE